MLVISNILLLIYEFQFSYDTLHFRTRHSQILGLDPNLSSQTSLAFFKAFYLPFQSVLIRFLSNLFAIFRSSTPFQKVMPRNAQNLFSTKDIHKVSTLQHSFTINIQNILTLDSLGGTGGVFWARSRGNRCLGRNGSYLNVSEVLA